MQAAVPATSGLRVVIATDDDPLLPHEPFLLTPPIRLADFKTASAAVSQGPSLSLGWVPGPAKDICVTVKIGAYALPDDLMIVRSMLATLQWVNGS